MPNKMETVLDNSTAFSTNGGFYEIDPVTKKCRKIFHELAKLELSDVDEIPLTTYQRYLKDKFSEDAVIKKGMLHFRGYRIYFSPENGFTIEDSAHKYALVETPFEGIPTPRELGDFFKKPTIEHTPEELREAVKRGKKALEKTVVPQEEPEPLDYEKLRKKVVDKVDRLLSGDAAPDFDPATFPDMIPVRRWKSKITKELKRWKAKKLRYKNFLRQVKEITMNEIFEKSKDTEHKNSFVGTILPEFKTVGFLINDTLTVDGKQVPAVPFIQSYLLHYEPKVMPALMKFANGEIDKWKLLDNPTLKDCTVEFNSKLLKNNSENAMLLTMLCQVVGLVAPQDMVYEGLSVGDKIKIWVDGRWKTETVTDIENGICLNKGVGLLKTDKWMKLDEKKGE